jgi:hypothetical protein
MPRENADGDVFGKCPLGKRENLGYEGRQYDTCGLI